MILGEGIEGGTKRRLGETTGGSVARGKLSKKMIS